MKKKKTLIIVTFLIAIVTLTILIVLKSNSKKFQPYQKYSLNISIIAASKDKVDTSIVSLKDDGVNASITSTKVLNEAYIFQNKLHYLDGNTHYVVLTDKTYRDLNRLVGNISKFDETKKDNESTYYTGVLSAGTANKILESLFINKKTHTNSLVEFSVKDNKISTYTLTLSDIENYEKITIVLNFKNIDNNFQVSTNRILKSLNKIEETDKNVFKFIN